MTSKYFQLRELVPPQIYQQFGNRSWWFLDHEAVMMVNAIRELLNIPLIVNNHHYNLSGYRVPDTPTGSYLSQHKRGAAFDIKSASMTAAGIYQFIFDNEQELMDIGLTTVEDIASTPTWVHVDCRWTGLSNILIVKPQR